MRERRKRTAGKAAQRRRGQDRQGRPQEIDRAQLAAEFARAIGAFHEQVLPGVDAFRAYMARQNRKVEVAAYLDHIEGPQIVVHLSRADGRITATLVAAVAGNGIRPYWDVQSSGRVKTHWVDAIPGGLDAVTSDRVEQKLIDLYTTDFS